MTLPPRPISFASFIAGASAMSIEILASRLIAPVVGTSIRTWTNLIGIILLALACGAWLGGYLADKRPDRRLLGFLLCASSALCLLLFLARPLGFWLSEQLPDAATVPLLAFILLAPPALLLGAVPPAAVRLAVHEVGTTGHIAGALSAIGTIGSLVGTYITGYILLAIWPVTYIIWLIMGILLISGLFLIKLNRRQAPPMAALFLCLFLPSRIWKEKTDGIEVPSPYSAMRVTEQFAFGTSSRLLWMDNSLHAAAAKDTLDRSLFPYHQLAQKLADITHPEAKSLLAIGGGGFHAVRTWIDSKPGRTASVIEYDPSAIKAAQEFLDLKDDPRLTIYTGDGRSEIKHVGGRFDIILVDAFADKLTIPWHLLTKQAWEERNQKLNENGLVLMNVILNRDPSNQANKQLLAGISNAIKPSKPYNEIITLSQDPNHPLINAVFVASSNEHDLDQINQWIEQQKDSRLTIWSIDQTVQQAFDDNFAPVEFISLKILNS